MRHRVHSHSFGRRPGPRKALLRGLVNSLIEHGRIKTTLAKAKELRRHVERAVTLGKKGDLATRRILISRTGCQTTAEKLIADFGPRFKDRQGGYTRILKLGHRAGDKAEMAFIEFVDYKMPEAKAETTVVGDKEAVKRTRAKLKERAAKKKRIRKIQAASRKRNRKS